MRRFPLVVLLLAAAAGCASSPASAPSDEGGGLAPSGAQDFGRFKALLENGRLPGPATLDQVGFFAEHKIGDPPTRCAEAVCAQATLGSMANMINGSTCTLLHLALGTPVDPMAQARPALDVAVVAEVGSPWPRRSIAEIRAGIGKLLDGLEATDTVTLVQYGEEARLLAARADRDGGRAALAALGMAGGTNLYDGLRLATETLGPPVAGRHRRLILLTAGRPSSVHADRVTRLVRDFAEDGGGVTVLALGEDGDPRLLQALADAGAGALYHVSLPVELSPIFEREVGYSLIPVAERVRVQLASGAAWRLREVFGLGRGSWSLAPESGIIDIPALYVAWRKAASGEDRRGGGGAILIEVLPRPGADPRQRPSLVANLDLSYALPGGGGRRSLSLQVLSPDGPGETRPEGRFDAPHVEKGFVVLNLYVALRMAAERAAAGDLRGARDVLDNVLLHAGDWEQLHPDVEIRDDLRYVRLFLGILDREGAQRQPPRSGWFAEPWPRD